MEINIPLSTEDLRIKHLPALLAFADFKGKEYDEITIQERLNVNSLFTGIPIDELKKYKLSSNNQLFNGISNSFSNFKTSKTGPLRELIFDIKDPNNPERIIKQKYHFVSDFTKLPTGWFVDATNIDFKKEPIRIPAMCYFEEGMNYAEQDQYLNILNSSLNRVKIFEEQLPLNVFLDVQVFFLLSYAEWMNLSTASEKRRKTIKTKMKELNYMIGKLQYLRSQRNIKHRMTK